MAPDISHKEDNMRYAIGTAIKVVSAAIAKGALRAARKGIAIRDGDS